MDRLLPTKLAVPRPSREPISRPRVREILDGALGARLILLSAPPGFGKSTALIDWLAASRIPGSWLSLDAADNDPARFLSYLWTAVSKLAIDDPSPDSSGAPPADAPEEVVAELATLLAGRREPSVLVLDDYQVISAPTVQRVVGLLLEHLPPACHLIIATRVDPSLPLARMRAQGELLELRADALRFTPEEAATFLAERMGVPLADDDLGTLMARTEGWPAVLQLAGLSLAGRTDVSTRVREFAASHRFVLDYITDEVLARLEPDDREFLLRTSVLDRLTGPLCDALTSRTDGQATLERLERANVLLVPLDDERRWYRYHHLFADLLRTRLAVLHPTEPGALQLRASTWYQDHGLVAEAIEHALRSGDDERARYLVRDASADLLHTAQFVTLRSALDRLPDAVVRSDILLSSRYAWALVLMGETEGVERRLADTEAALPAAHRGGDPQAPRMAATIQLIRSIAARLTHDPARAVEYAERGLALVPSEADPLTADARSLLGYALLEAGEVDRAVDVYRVSLPAERAAGNWIATGEITRNLVRLEVRRGRLRTALDTCDAALADLAVAGAAEWPAAAQIHLARAEALDRLGDPAGAAASAERAMALAIRGGDVATLRDARGVHEAATTSVGGRRTGLVEPLTRREQEVLGLVALGRSNREIAHELFVAVGTVKSHVNSLSGKLGAGNRVEAIAHARELGLLR